MTAKWWSDTKAFSPWFWQRAPKPLAISEIPWPWPVFAVVVAMHIDEATRRGGLGGLK